MTDLATARLRAIEFPAEAPELVELLGTIDAHDRVPWFPTLEGLVNDWAPTPAFDPSRDLRGLEVDGRLVGIARHSWRERPTAVHHRLEVYLHPEHRRRGHGSRLLAWAEARARAAAADGTGGPAELPHQFGGSHADDVVGFREFAAAHGYEPVRYHFEMRRPLDEPVPDAPLPPGIEVRPVVPEHYRAIWDADDEAFRDHWDHAAQVEGDFERFLGDPDLDPSLWQIAWDGDQVAALVINTIYAHENERSGEEVGWLDSVATRRPWRGRGIAAALIARSLGVLRDRGMEVAGLGVDSENPTGALQLYERLGFRSMRRWTFYRKPF
jgi:mycothiol synthase